MDDSVPGGTFAVALDRALAASRLSLAEVRRRLAGLGNPVSESTLRAWRAGERRPEHPASLEAVDLLEHVLDLPSGSLGSRLGPSRRLGRSRVEPYDSLAQTPGALAPLLRRVGFDPDEPPELECVGGTAVIDIGDDRRVRATSNRMLWRARRAGARRGHLKLGVDGPLDDLPRSTCRGAALGRAAHDPDVGLAVWEFTLPRALQVGETAMIEWCCHDGVDPAETTYLEGIVESRVDEGGIWVRFDGEVPRHVETFEDSAAGYGSRVVLPTGGSVEHHVRGFGPGVLGVRWQW